MNCLNVKVTSSASGFDIECVECSSNSMLVVALTDSNFNTYL